ncbi:hypothetical protein H7097_00760 [Aeromicrobium sp.]|nr:hypothetical protein [Candidatus Saccharibacteria bacterium]
MANKKQTTITLNGHRYDAVTGEAIDENGSKIASPTINDMVRSRPGAVALTPHAAKSPAAPLVPLSTSKVMDVSRNISHTKPHTMQRASTLVRSSVSKPRPGFKSQTKAISPTAALVPTSNVITTKWPVTQINPRRQTRAGQVAKSGTINKFATNAPVLEVPQAAATVKIHAPQPAVQALEPQSQQSQDMFTRAIAAADSHTFEYADHTKPGKSSRQARKQAKSVTKAGKRPLHHHTLSVVAASVAVLIIGGFVGLQYKTAITLRYANAQAGFTASLPSYQPDGYGVGNFNYSAGNVGTTFRSDASGNDYSLNQQTTKWDDQTLLDNYVAINYPNYQALQSGNRIMYVYGDNDASWIKNGVWYQLTTHGNLSTTQILSIAASV